MARADRQTVIQKKRVLYSDFLTNFDQNPHTGYLGVVTNEQAIKQSYKNLILTNKGERYGDSEKGSNIRAKLFDLHDTIATEALVLEIKSTLNAYEPRGEIINVEFIDSLDANALDIRLVFRAINDQDQIYSLDLHVQRVR